MTIDLENTGLMRLDRGAMQNWSDLRETAPHASAAIRRLVGEVVGTDRRVLVVGPTPIDIVTEIADVAGHLTVVSRSIPDSVAYAQSMVNRTNVDVVCGDLLNLGQPVGTHDVVLVLDDLAHVASLEDQAPTWQAVFDAVRACVAPGGRLVMTVENELGLHRITSLRSRYTNDDNSAWDVVATYDATRPRTRAALDDVLTASALEIPAIAGLLPAWDEHTVIAWNTDGASRAFLRVLDALTLSSPALRRLGADPTRVTRAAVLAGSLASLPSGWLVVTGHDLPREARVEASTTDAHVVSFHEEDGALIDGDNRAVEVPPTGELFGEEALDACAAGDAVRFRGLVQEWWQWAQGQAKDETLAASYADLRFDNLIHSADAQFVSVVAGAADERVELAAWRAVVDFVEVLKARGSRHLWPAATDELTIAATIGAMAGLPANPQLSELLTTRATQLDLPAQDVSGLLAVIERLEEKNAALASRADWFESKLNQRERELRGRAKRQSAELALANRQQEVLRKSAEDVRRSITYRLGNVAMGPLKEAKKRFIKE